LTKLKFGDWPICGISIGPVVSPMQERLLAKLLFRDWSGRQASNGFVVLPT